MRDPCLTTELEHMLSNISNHSADNDPLLRFTEPADQRNTNSKPGNKVLQLVSAWLQLRSSTLILLNLKTYLAADLGYFTRSFMTTLYF